MEIWLGTTRFNATLMAMTEKGICAFFFGADEMSLLDEYARLFPNVKPSIHWQNQEPHPIFDEIAQALEHNQFVFNHPLDLTRGTVFQQTVWHALKTIPFGETRTYKQIAEQIGRPKSARAVAQACAANALALLVPCHRVIRSDHRLGGYRWTEEFKAFLLLCEQVVYEQKK